jgi:hypothetical protein
VPVQDEEMKPDAGWSGQLCWLGRSAASRKSTIFISYT